MSALSDTAREDLRAGLSRVLSPAVPVRTGHVEAGAVWEKGVAPTLYVEGLVRPVKDLGLFVGVDWRPTRGEVRAVGGARWTFGW